MAKKQLSAEPKKKTEVVEVDLEDEDHTAVDLMEKEGHMEIGLPALVGNHMETDLLTEIENQPQNHMEIDQEHHIVRRDQTLLLVEQDQNDKKYTNNVGGLVIALGKDGDSKTIFPFFIN